MPARAPTGPASTSLPASGPASTGRPATARARPATGPRPRGSGPRFDRPPPGDRPRFDRPPPGDRPRFDRPPPGDRPRFDRPPPGDRPRFDRPAGDRPAPSGERPRFDRPRGDRPTGDARAPSERPYGRPAFERPQGDRPRFDKPRSDRPAPSGERPRFDRPAGERPRFDKPRSGGAPRSDKPRYDRDAPKPGYDAKYGKAPGKAPAWFNPADPAAASSLPKAPPVTVPVPELPKVLESDVSDSAPGLMPKPSVPTAPVAVTPVVEPALPIAAVQAALPATSVQQPIAVRNHADPRPPEVRRFDQERSHSREHEPRPPKARAARPPETFQQPPAEGEAAAVVNRKGAERFAQGHPWVYESDVLALSPHAKSGEVVRVLDGRGWFIGRAALSLQSKIRLRLLSREEVPADKEFFKARLQAAIALRKMAYPTEQSYRVVHGEADQIPGLIVDKYGDHVTMQLLTQHADANRAMWIELINELLSPVCIVERSDVKVRALEGLEPVKGVVSGTLRPGLTYREGNVELGLDLVDGQKTGSFLDQRENHIAAGLYAHGKALDCFSYVGGFALQMAKAGAEVTALEISGPACELIRQNGTRNGVTVTAIEGNAFDYLRDQLDAGTRFDTIVLDPPAFAKSKDAIDAAHRGYKEINLRALQLLNPGGILVTASCSYHVSEDAFENILFDAAKDAQKQVQIVEKRGAGRDHPVLVSLRETRYLKCFVLRVL